jgi:hypothetical protein
MVASRRAVAVSSLTKSSRSSKVLLGAFAVVAAVAFLGTGFLVLDARRKQRRMNELAALGQLRTIASMEVEFRKLEAELDGKPSYGDLVQLLRSNLIDSERVFDEGSGYIFWAEPGDDPGRVWIGVARPAIPGTTGERVFYANQTAEIVSLPIAAGQDPVFPSKLTGEPPPGCRHELSGTGEPDFDLYR